jgi:hypothetical protein
MPRGSVSHIIHFRPVVLGLKVWLMGKSRKGIVQFEKPVQLLNQISWFPTRIEPCKQIRLRKQFPFACFLDLHHLGFKYIKTVYKCQIKLNKF